jgi:hypothetical protein
VYPKNNFQNGKCHQVFLKSDAYWSGGGTLHFLNFGVLCFMMDPLEKLKL